VFDAGGEDTERDKLLCELILIFKSFLFTELFLKINEIEFELIFIAELVVVVEEVVVEEVVVEEVVVEKVVVEEVVVAVLAALAASLSAFLCLKNSFTLSISYKSKY
jgi:hypothetical protein